MKRLLIRPGAIGDFIVSLPALESLRTDYTEVWCRSDVIPLVQFADRVISIVGSGLDRIGLLDAGAVIARLREFDEIHSWYGTNRPEFQDACCSLPFRFYPALPTGSTVPAVDFYLQQIGRPAGTVPRVLVDVQPREEFAVLHPFSGSAHKNWPLARFQELAVVLGNRMPVHWCCGPEDSLPGAIVIPDLLELARWLGRARVFVGNDSGISHLCAATGTPVHVIFGGTNPLVWAPRGREVTIHPYDITAPQLAEAVR